jgi:hypothetical protein
MKMARENTFKSQALAFIAENTGKGLKRKDYIDAFMAFGMKESAASLYHYLNVTKVAKLAAAPVAVTPVETEVETPVDETEVEDMIVAAAPRRDAKGRFIKRS